MKGGDATERIEVTSLVVAMNSKEALAKYQQANRIIVHFNKFTLL